MSIGCDRVWQMANGQASKYFNIIKKIFPLVGKQTYDPHHYHNTVQKNGSEKDKYSV